MPNDAKPWPQYKCHKVVGALKIKEVLRTGRTPKGDLATRISFYKKEYAPIMVDDSFMNQYKPKIDGYIVVYSNGWMAYSPAEVFDEGYTLLDGAIDYIASLMIPVYHSAISEIFVEQDLIKPTRHVFPDKDKQLTSAIKFGVCYSFTGICHRDALPFTDATLIPEPPSVQSVYMSFNDGESKAIMEFNLADANHTQFSDNTSEFYGLTCSTELTIGGIPGLPERIGFDVELSGYCKKDYSSVMVFVSSYGVARITAPDGTNIPRGTPEFSKIMRELGDYRVIGYTLCATRLDPK